MSIKQVLVVRKDLKMRRGKELAQVSHASMKVFFDIMVPHVKEDLSMYGRGGDIETYEVPHTYICKMTEEMDEWKRGIFTKICVKVNSEEELISVYEKAKEAGIPSALITDSGKTEFNGVPTKTCCAIGPYTSEEIDKITGNLQLY